MNKKGFTLVELMGIIIILSLMSLLVIPSIDRSIKNFKEKAYESQIQTIRLAAKDWAIENIGLYTLLENESITISLSQLKTGGYIDDEFIDPNTDIPFADDMEIDIIRVKESLRYFVQENSGYRTGLTTTAPIINLNGEFIERLSDGDIYTEKGAIASDYTKTIDLTDSISKRYSSDVSSYLSSLPVPMTPGNYTIRYGINHSGFTRYIYRLVIVN